MGVCDGPNSKAASACVEPWRPLPTVYIVAEVIAVPDMLSVSIRVFQNCRSCRHCRTVGLSELSELSELSDCRTVGLLSDCRMDCRTVGRWTSAITEGSLSDAVGHCRATVGLSDCRTVGLSEDCRTLSDTTVGLSDQGSNGAPTPRRHNRFHRW